QEQLFLSHATERRLYGYREPAVRSRFLGELPQELISSTNKLKAKKSKSKNLEDKVDIVAKGKGQKGQDRDWQKGDLLIHDTFGTGEVTHVFGSGNKISIAVKFPGLGQKILDPKQTSLQRVN
ncbi:MAG TPA: hypothetical protein DC064_02685, partial [Cyanobacteria bacterium UBA9273]|nr:hypothetical protein [Cyanobacteria bacterium UBA9273]